MIDTHAHIQFPEFGEDRESVVKRARAVGLDAIVCVGCGAKSSQQAVELADGEFLYATVGLHPYDSADCSDELFDKWAGWISEGKHIVAVGETGLDYFKAKVDREVQKDSFRRHCEFAVRMKLPVIVHNRDADEDSLAILQEFKGVKAVFHCYGSDLVFARKVWDAGFLTSFTGIITYPNAEELRAVVAEVPMDKFMVETDCPYLAPQSERGERNEPSFVKEVLERVAEVKGLTFEEVERASDENSKKFLGLA